MMRWIGIAAWFGMAAGAAAASPINDVLAVARASFDAMPSLKLVETIEGHCGASADVNPQVAYCTTSNTIFVSEAHSERAEAAYMVAHLVGHAVQVQHGVADTALREIRRRPADEQTLRGFVAGQVDCIAGFLYARTGLPAASLAEWFAQEPFRGRHWGRSPLSVGPEISVGLATRDRWFQTGQAARTLGDCAVGEFSADLLLEAYRQ